MLSLAIIIMFSSPPFFKSIYLLSYLIPILFFKVVQACNHWIVFDSYRNAAQQLCDGSKRWKDACLSFPVLSDRICKTGFL